MNTIQWQVNFWTQIIPLDFVWEIAWTRVQFGNYSTSDILKFLKIARAFRRVQFEKFQNITSAIIPELYELFMRFLVYNFSTKLQRCFYIHTTRGVLKSCVFARFSIDARRSYDRFELVNNFQLVKNKLLQNNPGTRKLNLLETSACYLNYDQFIQNQSQSSSLSWIVLEREQENWIFLGGH